MSLRSSIRSPLIVAAATTMLACQALVTLEHRSGAGETSPERDGGDAAPGAQPRRYATVYGGPLALACVSAPIVEPADSVTIYVGGSLDDHETAYEWRFDNIEVRTAESAPALQQDANAATASPGCSGTNPSVTGAWPRRLWCNDFDGDGAADVPRFGFAGALGIEPGSLDVELDTQSAASAPRSLSFKFPPSTSEVSRAFYQGWSQVDASNIRIDFQFRYGSPSGSEKLDRSVAFFLIGIGRGQSGVAFGTVGKELALAFVPRVTGGSAGTIETAAVKLGDSVDATKAFLPVALELTTAPPAGFSCTESCLFADAGCL